MLIRTKNWARFALTSLALMVLLFVIWAPALQASVVNEAVAQGYSSDTPLQPGIIVRLDSTNSSKVLPLSTSSESKMLGVVIASNDAAITLGSNQSTNQVYVTDFGQHDVLVSNQNGPIQVGDYISISSIAGVGMKDDGTESLVLGQAAGNFDGIHNVVDSSSLTVSGNKKTTINIGLIPVDISIQNNPLNAGPKGLPTFLGKITKFATDKSVSAARVYLSMFIVLVGIVLTATIIYSGIKNGLISMGRNPLAKRAINGSMVRVVVVGVIVFAISLGVAYAVLL